MTTLWLCHGHAQAADTPAGRLVKIDTRPGVTVGVYVIPTDHASATVMLLPGGSGSLAMRDGAPQSQNFLIRSHTYFLEQGFNVVMVGRPSDRDDLDVDFRASATHVEDLRKVINWIHQEMPSPLWLVGTSRGTVSAASAAIAVGKPLIDGVVLSSSITSYKWAASVPRLKLSAIQVPVLVMHHEKDGCFACQPHEAHWIVDGLKRAPIKKLLLVNGGGNPQGDSCGALHWHGYIGMEKEAVGQMAAWIKRPES
ncbi:MAG: alpha/beta hydrolase [Betaproteobacteria bacterium]|nr:alpha/beta hydrolase [Betaproteobacteria bacterium]